jgi:hypothetical protein
MGNRSATNSTLTRMLMTSKLVLRAMLKYHDMKECAVLRIKLVEDWSALVSVCLYPEEKIFVNYLLRKTLN